MAPSAGVTVSLGKGDLRGEGVSGLTGQGVDALVGRIRGALEERVAGAGVMTRARHRYAMEAAVEALESAENRVRVAGAELVAEELRRAGRALDVLVGRVDVENLLDEIFSSFCIGK